MNKKMKIVTLIMVSVLSIFGTPILLNSDTYSEWIIENKSQNPTEISWAKFQWTNEQLGNKHFEKTAMMIPCKINGIENIVTFQFDLGCDVTGIYENTFNSLSLKNPLLNNRIKFIRNKVRFWKTKNVFDDLKIQFGNYLASNKESYLFNDRGEKLALTYPNDTIHLGTIGRDLFKDKILIIDYPKQQFAICEAIPKEYDRNLIDIEIDYYGRIILPMKLKNKDFRILFDNGSSIFPIITPAKNISNFSKSIDIDTITVSSWGKKHDVTSKILKDTFELAGQKFHNVLVYANHSGLGIDNKTDGMTGNALFWDKMIIIDFKNKKFGVK
jgi:hypothetical protein